MINIKNALNTAIKQLAVEYPKYEALKEAQLLLSHVLNKNSAYLYSHDEEILLDKQYTQYETLLKKRLQGTPIAYLIGNKAFWSRDFMVSPAVLIPRPETELLIELILKFKGQESQLTCLDLGTGSGIIAITIALEMPDWHIFAIEKSFAAIDIAIKNTLCFNTARINFLVGNWLDAVTNSSFFDVIVANPPYVAMTDMHLSQGDLRFEPKNALAAKNAGLEDLFIIIEQSIAKLKKNGLLLLEHGFNQAAAVTQKMLATGFLNVQTFQDLQGLDRVTIGCLI